MQIAMQAESSARLFIQSLLAAYSEQLNYELLLKESNCIKGSLQYSVYQNIPSIIYIEVGKEWQQSGIGSALVHELQRLYPTEEIDWGGFLTQDGLILRNSLKFREVETKYAALTLELSEIIIRLEDYTKRNADGKLQDFESSQWNDLHDRRYDLEFELIGNATTKKIVVTEI